MKAFKKLALVTAIAAAPFAQAELTSIDDAALSDMTGQAGITIELDTSISIANLNYTDTDGYDGGTSGTLGINGIVFGGAAVAGSNSSVHDARLDDFKIDIDVDGTEGVVIHLGGTDSSASMVGLNPVDFGLHIDSVTSSGVTSNIASDINIAGNLGPIDVKINNVSGGDLIDVQAYFEVTSGSLDVDVIGLGITNLTIGQDSMPLLSGGAYQQDIRNALATALSNPALATADAATLALAIDGAAAGDATIAAEAAITAGANAGIHQAAYDADFLINSDVDLANAAGDAAVLADAGATATGAIAADAGVTAAAVLAAANAQNVNNMAFVSLTVGNGSANYTSLTEGAVTVTNALEVNLTSFNVDIGMDISMGTTGVNARSIGSIAINDLDMSGTVLKIYGH